LSRLAELIHRLSSKTATIAAVGLGYAGLPLALRFSEAGYSVLGIDIDLNKVKELNAGRSYIKHIPSTAVQSAIKHRFCATSEFERISEADAIIICVPTPLGRHREPDLSYIHSTIESVIPFLRPGQIISLESTTYPGTTEDIIQSSVEAHNFVVGENIFLVYSPEREDPGNHKFETRSIPKVVGGITSNCLKAGVALYEAAVDQVIPMSSARAAEMTKLLENIHRAVNIGLVNEIKIVADRMSIDIYEVIRAAATKPFGFTPYYPGPGLGGHCIPIDPFYLTWKAREYGINTRFIELAGEVNRLMPEWVVGKITAALNERGKPVSKSHILILGIAYKKDVDDVRESASIQIMELLRDRHAKLSYCDPYVPIFPVMREHKFDMESVNLNEVNWSEIDCVLIATNHTVFDYELVASSAPLIVDTRGVYSEIRSNVVRA
jgi:UDP-N-acetyl-D-glucosamine dehydrogenase